MKKEEIFEKSRKENSGKFDEREMAADAQDQYCPKCKEVTWCKFYANCRDRFLIVRNFLCPIFTKLFQLSQAHLQDRRSGFPICEDEL